MTEQERKSATILAMDVVGYSFKMSKNEAATVAQLRVCQGIIEEVSKDKGGRIFNTAGDAFMIEFPTTIGAVETAIEIQEKVAAHNKAVLSEERLEFRMGVNIGDVTIDGENLLGDGVNIAARLEGIAPPAGICISEAVHSTVKGKVSCSFIDKGAQNLKNIEEPVRAYYADIQFGDIDPKKFKTSNTKNKTAVYFGGFIIVSIVAILLVINHSFERIEELNKIVVLPLETNSQNQQQINLAVGLTQDISGALTGSSKQLNIINLNKIPEDLASIHNETQASYLIKGSIRTAGDNLRVSINLIDAKDLSNIWTDNYDRKFDINSIFQIQDEIVKNIVNELVGNGAVLSRDIAKNISSKGTTNLSAYECVNFVRGQFFKVLSTSLHIKSLDCLKQAVEDDPEYKEAWQLLSQMYTWGVALYARLPKEESFKQAEIAVDNALRIDKDFARAYASKAELYMASGRMDAGFGYGETAVNLAPNDAATVGMISYLSGLPGFGCHSTNELLRTYEIDRDDACAKLERSFELASIAHKLDEGNIYSYDNYGLGNYYMVSRNWDKVIEVFEKIPNPGFVWWVNAMALAYHGIRDEKKALEMFAILEDLAGPNPLSRLSNEFGTWGKAKIFYDEMVPVYKKYGFK